jgi:hypothetical protein
MTSNNSTRNKANLLFLILGAFFITNALLAEFVGAKIFSLEATLGLPRANIDLFGEKGLDFDMTAGVLLWPVVFIMTDVINEYFGQRGVRLLSFLAVGLIIYAFFMIYMTIETAPADFWRVDQSTGMNMNLAYQKVFGQGMWIIAGSLTAFLIGQISDVLVFHRLRRWTGQKAIWLRATGSTVVSQLIDSFVVLFIAFYWGADWSVGQTMAVAIVNYIYKFVVAVALTPFLYVIHGAIDRYLGEELANELMAEAARSSQAPTASGTARA